MPYIKHNYLTPILNSQYLSGINYLNAASAAAGLAAGKTASTSTSLGGVGQSSDNSSLLEKISTSLNQSLVSEGISNS